MTSNSIIGLNLARFAEDRRFILAASLQAAATPLLSAGASGAAAIPGAAS